MLIIVIKCFYVRQYLLECINAHNHNIIPYLPPKLNNTINVCGSKYSPHERYTISHTQIRVITPVYLRQLSVPPFTATLTFHITSFMSSYITFSIYYTYFSLQYFYYYSYYHYKTPFLSILRLLQFITFFILHFFSSLLDYY